ncbi:MAG: hypothetical protein O3A53_16850 [Acidobacteria bacterium]|nr:hypothetical protein [Acidobacteriota bacterium]MDA1236454.1 hypothetical protein [Acidobacteriota bacterium]
MLQRNLAASAERRTCALCAFCVLALLFGLGYEGVFISLSQDDLMNLHFGMREPFARLLLANLFPFTTVFRPAGAALYVSLFEAVGFDPISYRVVTYGILLLGCVALYRLVKELDGRATAAAFAPIFLVFHSGFLHIYSENAYVYDPLCGALFAATLLFYHQRRRHGPLRLRDAAILYLLWAATVNSKEMGLTLAVVLMAYEAVFSRPLAWRNFAWPGVLLGMSFVAWRGKIALGSPLYEHRSYQPSVDFARLVAAAQQQLAEATLASTATISVVTVAVILTLFVAVALACRTKAALFGLLWALITPWPILAIGGRPFSALYVTWIGVAIVLGSVTAETVDRLKVPEKAKPFAVVVVAAFWALAQWNDMGHRPSIQQAGAQWEQVRDAIDDYAHIPGLCESNSVLVLDTRFGNDRYHPLFIAHLLCSRYETGIYIPGLNVSDEDADARFKEYDLVLRDHGQDLEVVRHRRDP